MHNPFATYTVCMLADLGVCYIHVHVYLDTIIVIKLL